jgi:hypothetical protein
VRFNSSWGNKYNGYITSADCKSALLYQIDVMDFGVGEFESLCAHFNGDLADMVYAGD